MSKNNELKSAIRMLVKECKVIPDKYTMYNNAYLFLAYPPNVKDKKTYMSPWYLVDLKDKVAGPFSPAFDLNGFFKATENLINI